MRVRYGKSIKVKSIVGQQTNLTADNSFNVYSVTSVSTVALCNHKFGYSTVPDTSSRFNNDNPIQIIEGHKYFVHVKVHNMLDRSAQRWMCMRFISTAGSSSALSANIYSYTWKFTTNTVSAILTGTSSGNLAYTYFGDFPSDQKMTVATEYPESYLIIDLTDIYDAGYEPSTQQFYETYFRLFDDISSFGGVDFGSGQVAMQKTISSDYTELEYIASSGTQYIELDFGFDNTDKIESKFSVDTDGQVYDKYMISPNSWNTNKNRFAMGVHNAYFTCAYGDTTTGGTALSPWTTNDGLIHEWKYKDKIYSIPELNISKDCSSITWGTTTANLKLFYGYSTNTKGKMCYYKHWKNNIKVIDLIPAIRKSDSAIGMLDKVNNVFYTNQGTGTFIAGPVKELPSEYQQVDYIEGTGTQYMTQWTIGKAYTGNLTVGYKFNVTEHTSDMYFSTITSNQSAGQAYSLGYTTANSPLYIRWNQVQSSATQVDYTIPEIKEITRTNVISNITLNYVSLFCHSTNYKPWKGRIYKYWLKIDDEYIFDFIPCYRKSDNEIGLYDRIKRVFYNNVGTGTFLKGNNVNNTISCKIAGGSSDIYYGYNQLLNYDYSYPTTVSPENGTVSKSGKQIIFTKNENTNYYAVTMYTTYRDRMAKYGDKIYCKITFSNITSSLIGKSSSFGCEETGSSGWLRNPSKSITFTSGQDTYEVIDNVTNTNTDSVHVKILHTTGSSIYGELFTIESCEMINLTTWFGAGKEPTTVDEFKQKFTKDYYGFCPTPIKLTRYQIEALPSYGYNQIANINRSSTTIRGITFVNNENNTLTITGTSQSSDNTSIGNMEIIEGHKYYGFTNVISGSLSTSTYWIKWVTANYGKDIGEGILFTATSSVNPAYCSFYVEGANININTKVQMMLIDLTDWYGAGSEPTTVAEFKATFPNLYYPYSKKRLLNKYMINKLIN